jgi:tetratricopeptide (TPR) repeat protein
LGEPGLGVNGTMVGRWERGEREPRPPYPKLLAALYGTDAHELGLMGSRGPAGCGRLEDDMERRTLLRLLAGALAAPVLGWDTADAHRLAGALGRPSRADEATVAVVEASIANARRLDDLFGPRVAVKPALAQREVIRTLLGGGPSEAVRGRLAEASAGLSQLLGWLAFDMNDHATARAYFNEGLQTAREAEAQPLVAYLLGHLSSLSNYEGKPPEALAFAEAARGHSELGPLQSWLAAVEAEASAAVHDRAGTEKALDRARATFAAAEEGLPWLYFWDQPELESWVGTCYVRLNLAEPARQALEQTLAGADASMVRDHAIFFARLAATYLPDGEIEEVCRLAGEALTIAASTRSDRAVQRVRELRAQLAPWAAETTVRDLDDHLASTEAWFRPPVLSNSPG